MASFTHVLNKEQQVALKNKAKGLILKKIIVKEEYNQFLSSISPVRDKVLSIAL